MQPLFGAALCDFLRVVTSKVPTREETIDRLRYNGLGSLLCTLSSLAGSAHLGRGELSTDALSELTGLAQNYEHQRDMENG